MADIRLAIAVDSSGAVRSIKTFNDEVEKVPAAGAKAGGAVTFLQKQFQSFTEGLTFGAGFAAAQKGFAMLTSAVSSASTQLLQYSDTMVTAFQRTGVALSSLQALSFIAKTSGTDFGALSNAVVKMEVAIGKGSESFGKLGLSLSQLKAMSPDDAFAKVAAAIGGIESPMQRASAAVAIFGKSGAEMLPLFANNLAAMKKQAEEFGLILKDRTLNAAEALGDAIETTGMAFQALGMRIVGAVAESPAILGFFNGLSQIMGDMAPRIEGSRSAFENFAKNGVGFAVDALQVFLKVVDVVIGVVESLMIIWKAAGIAALAFGRAVLELDRMRSYVSGGAALRAEIDARVAGAKLIQDELRKEQQLIKDNRTERGKFVTDLADSMNRLRTAGPMALIGGGGNGGPGGTFDGVAGGGGSRVGVANESKAWESFYDRLADGASKAVSSFIASSSNKAAMPGLERYIMDMLPKTLAVPLGPDGRPKVFNLDNSTTAGNTAVAKSSMTASQALQTLANIAQTSGSKLGKGLASIFGGGAGIGAGLDMFNKAGSGLTGLLGKIGGIGSIASAGISAISGLFGLFKKKPKEPPPEPPKQATAAAWSSFTGDQQSKAAAGILAGVSGIRVSTPEDMAAQAGIALSAYWQVFKDKGPMAAAEAFKPVRDKMLETFKAAGADDAAIAALLGPMSGQIDLAGNEAFAGAAAGMKGFADALAAMANQQLPMTIDQFRAFELQAVNGFNQMRDAALAQGLSMEDAITNAAMASGTYLQTIKDAAAKYGFDLGGSQALFDQATAAGVAFGGSSQERLILSIDALTETLGGAPPKFQAAITAGVSGAGGARPAEGVAINGSLDRASASLDRVAGVLAGLADRPIVVESNVSATLNVDGDAIASATADAIDRGGYGGTRMREATEGRG